MKLLYPAVFTPWDEGDGYTVEFTDLPGCITEGKDLAEAIEMAEDAACGWILTELESGNTYPAPSNRNSVRVPDGSFVNFILLDIDNYAERYGSKAVRKNITIPAWLNSYGERNHINFSRVLTDALLRQAEAEATQ